LGVPAAWGEWLVVCGLGGFWRDRGDGFDRRTLTGDLDDVAYLHGLLVVEGFFRPLAEARVGRELRRGHLWGMVLRRWMRE